MHDPTQVNRQGPDRGSQYRSIVLTHSDEQRTAAEASRDRVQSRYERPVATEIQPFVAFYPAEDYHQRYYLNNGHEPYCHSIPPACSRTWGSSAPSLGEGEPCQAPGRDRGIGATERSPAVPRPVRRCMRAGRPDRGRVPRRLSWSRWADVYSDVDLCVIASNDAYEALIRDRAAFVGRLGTPLFLEDFGFSDLVFFILDDGTEGELFLGSEERLEELEPGPTIRTLFDPGGILEGVVFAEERMDRLSSGKCSGRSSWFWHELALHHRDGTRRALVGRRTTRVAPRSREPRQAEHGAFAGEEPYELDRTIDLPALSPIAETFVPMERDTLLRAARELVRFYTEKAPGVAEANGATYPRAREADGQAT